MGLSKETLARLEAEAQAEWNKKLAVEDGLVELAVEAVRDDSARGPMEAKAKSFAARASALGNQAAIAEDVRQLAEEVRQLALLVAAIARRIEGSEDHGERG